MIRRGLAVEVVMIAALAQTLSRATRENVDTNSLSVVLIFCGIGLLISLVAIFCGFDFSDVLL
jgi:hypothetical protein